MNRSQAAWRAAKALVPDDPALDRNAFIVNMGAKLIEQALLEFFERELPARVALTDKARGLLQRSALRKVQIDDRTLEEVCLELRLTFME